MTTTPKAEPMLPDARTRTATWADASERLAAADTYWLATSGPGGAPHLVPVLGVWVEDALYFSAGARTRKARNLAARPACVVSARSPDLDLVVEGAARIVRSEGTLRQVAEAYATKYEWEVAISDGAFAAEGAPTAGPPPYDVYEIVATVAFGFPTAEESFSPTRWRF